jgi:hypothetical protein
VQLDRADHTQFKAQLSTHTGIWIAYVHINGCGRRLSVRNNDGCGLADFEMERVWAWLRGFAGMLAMMRTSTRNDLLDDLVQMG